ncbi:MAG: outer rane lipase/esterase [Verrucomicrobiota bacterium]|jgi:phospholipase/lecithinase/hemolysin
MNMNPPRRLPSPLFSPSATGLLLLASLCLSAFPAFAQQPTPTVAPTPSPNFSQIVVFGDSLSDTGNVRARTNSKSGGTVDFPSETFNYSDGRFTNSSDTDPASNTFAGVWHEQLARTFLNLPAATFSLGGGTNYAFGGATTKNGTHEEVVVSTDIFGDLTITIDDMGRQMDDYLAGHVVDPNALYVVWGGGNDLFNDDSAANVTATAARATALMSRLARAGARFIMVPNVPPLGTIPEYSGNSAKATSLSAASANYRLELSADLTAGLSVLASEGIKPAVYPVDAWTNTVRILHKPAAYGFTNINGSAQGQSNVNPDQYLFWDRKHPTTAGHYQTAKGAHDALILPFVPNAKAVNIATRIFVDTDERVAIAGFIVSGNISKKVLIRGLGPSLAANNVPNLLADPNLALFDEASNPLQSNDNWRQSPDATAIMNTGIPPKNDAESAIIASLAPGHYTAVLSGVNATAGNGLIEVYDLETGTSSTFGNVSTRGYVGAGDNAMIGGLIIGDGELPIVVLRAIGPTLMSSGIGAPLFDPTIELHDGNGTIIAFNDNWKEGQPQAVVATQFAPSDDRESVIVAFLAPGNYTAVVRGKADTTGVALFEAYRIP